jgi:diguanylate cyclase (GGDEF)-like protein
MQTRLVSLLLAFLWPAAAFALPADRSIDQFIHRSWTVDEGLPHSTVRAIAQTPDGYLWFGTPDGLARFDGQSFDVHESPLFAPLRGVGIYALKVAGSGALYIAARGKGLWRYQGGTLARVAERHIESAGGAMAEDAQGRLWVSLDGDGVARLEGEAVRKFTAADGLPSGTVRALLARPDGEVLVGTNRGIAAIRGENVVANPAGRALDGVPVTALLAGKQGRVWIATASNGVFWWDGEVVSVPPVNAAARLRETAISQIIEDRDGTVWIGTTDGIVRWRSGQAERFTTREGLSSNTLRSFFEDSEGGIWAGTDAGVNRFRNGVVRVIGQHQGITEEFVRAVLEDRQGRIWVGTSDGLFQLGKSGAKRFGRGEGLIDNSVLSLAEDAAGTLWAGTYAGGLHRFSGRRFEALAGELRKTGERVRAIVSDGAGSLWVGTTAGLYRVDAASGHVRERTDPARGLASELVNALHMDEKGRLWVGTRDGLYVRQAGGAFRLVAAAENVLALSRGDEGRLWVGTERGIGVVDLAQEPPAFSPPAARSALPARSYFGVIEDGRGTAWTCGNRGLLRMPVAALVSPPPQKSGLELGELFGRNDGMPTAQCNGATQPSAWKTRDGRLLFATARGLAEIDPATRTATASAPPEVLIKALTLDGAPLPLNPLREIVLPPGSHRLQIEFIGISLSAPERVRYEFRLVGHEDNWIDAKADTKAVFANLPSGRYRFEVRARFSGGLPGERMTALELVQSPRLIETWWFRVLLAAGLIGAILAVISLRVRNLERQRLLLRETVEARTAELEGEKRKLETLNDERTRLLMQVADSARAFERLAKEDSLTGLANRRELDRLLAAEFARAARGGRPLSVALGDIDHFKRINDEFSHAVGDEVLKRVAELLKAGVRKIDYAGRYGGEEFLLVLPEAPLDVALQICERLRESVASAPDFAAEGGHRPAVTMSFGVASLGSDATHERLIARADAKLYEAKHGGRNRVAG